MEEAKRTYLCDSDSRIAKRFWEDVKNIRVDPLNRQKGETVHITNRSYKELGYRECKTNIEHVSSYATHRPVGVATWLAHQDKYRGVQAPDLLKEEFGDISIQQADG